MSQKSLKVAINGFGRIGRLIFRQGFESLNIVAVNGTSSPERLAHFLEYDSVHGPWKKKIQVDSNSFSVEGKKILCLQEKSPDLVDWGKYQVDLVIECTGRFKKSSDWKSSFSKGLKKVLVSAPATDPDFTLVYGVNHHLYNKDKDHFISNASCTSNCLAPIIKVLQEDLGIEQGFFSTVHSYTNDQRLLDSSHKDLRRARAAGLNIIPTSTGAAGAISLIFPALKGRLHGRAFRVPTANVSLLDLVLELKKESSLEELKQAFQEASKGELKGVLALSEKELVSSDFIGRKESALLDWSLSQKTGKLFKLVAWYDNEAGFSQRIIDFLSFMEKRNSLPKS